MIGIKGIVPAVKQIETGGMLATVDFNMFKVGSPRRGQSCATSRRSRCRKR